MHYWMFFKIYRASCANCAYFFKRLCRRCSILRGLGPATLRSPSLDCSTILALWWKKFFGSACGLPVSKVTDQQISDQEPNLPNGYAKAKCQCPHPMIKNCTRAWEAQTRHVFVFPIAEGGLYKPLWYQAVKLISSASGERKTGEGTLLSRWTH